MIRACIEIDCGGDNARTLSVMARSLLRALELAEEQNPGCTLNVVFPLDPETFFVRKDSKGAGVKAAEIAA